VRYLLAAILISLAVPFSVRAECDMKVADLPEIHGLRLGRSRREVERVYTVTPTSAAYKFTDPENVKYLEGIWFDFYQDSLAYVEFDYNRNTEWKNVHEFAAFLGLSLKLPIESWVFVDRTEAVMKCEGFDVSISSVRNTLSLSDRFASTAAKQNLAGAAQTRERAIGQ
jgi:hypothetical protein